MDVDVFRDRLDASIAHADFVDLVRDSVLDVTPYAFAHEPAKFQDLQSHLGNRLGIASTSIVLVGSGAAGYSSAPDTLFRAFHAGSDLDVAVVDAGLFDSMWSVLLRWGHPVRNRVPREVDDWFRHRRDEIFWGWIDPKRLRFNGVTRPKLLKSLRELQAAWLEAFNSISSEFPGEEFASREISGRLYRSNDHLLHYQANGLKIARRRWKDS